MFVTNNLIDSFFDDTFAIKRMNEIIRHKEITHDDDGATIKLKVPGFNKRYAIDNKFDFDSIDAKVVDGLLTLTLPYKAEVKPRKIKVT